MPKKRHSEEQIIAALKQQEAEYGFATVSLLFHLLTELRDATLARGAGGGPPR